MSVIQKYSTEPLQPMILKYFIPSLVLCSNLVSCSDILDCVTFSLLSDMRGFKTKNTELGETTTLTCKIIQIRR